MAGFKSEWWPESNRNGGRLQIGIPGRIASEFAANRVQLTTDGHGPYLEAVEDAFGADIDYAQLVKIYCEPPQPTG